MLDLTITAISLLARLVRSITRSAPMPADNSFRCTHCDLSYPKYKTYETCPLCDQPTWATHDPAAMTPTHATRIVADELAARDTKAQKREAFENYYAERGYACSLCAEPVVLVRPANQLVAYGMCPDCDQAGPEDTHTITSLGGMDAPLQKRDNPASAA